MVQIKKKKAVGYVCTQCFGVYLVKDWLMILSNFSRCFNHFRFTAQEHQMGRRVNKNYLAESSIESVGSCWKAVLTQFVLQEQGLLSKMKGQWYQQYTSEVCIFGACSERH